LHHLLNRSVIATDIDSTIRATGIAPTGPTIGAHEAPALVALPVQLIYLEAYPVNNQFIQVAWATETEINNKQFNIERSTDGLNWVQIDSVPGHGNTTTETAYTYNDMHAEVGVRYYYKLRQIDYNGNFIYTDVVTAMLTGETSFNVTLAPNPASNRVNLFIVSPDGQEIEVVVYDVLGQRVISGGYQLMQGSNQIPLDVSRLASGTYSVVVNCLSQRFTQKLVVTR
jgi:Secretion system C-terminal sorting domain